MRRHKNDLEQRQSCDDYVEHADETNRYLLEAAAGREWRANDHLVCIVGRIPGKNCTPRRKGLQTTSAATDPNAESCLAYWRSKSERVSIRKWTIVTQTVFYYMYQPSYRIRVSFRIKSFRANLGFYWKIVLMLLSPYSEQVFIYKSSSKPIWPDTATGFYS